MNLDLNLLPHQVEFISDNTTRDLALVGGRGCGKTYSLCLKLIVLAMLQAGHVGAALSPSGPMAAKVLIPQMHQALARLNVKYDFNRSERRFDLHFGDRKTTIYVLSAENVRDGLGLNLAFFGIDEADTIKTDVAFEAWRKLSGALRNGDPRYQQKVAVSTPEGFGFMQQHWVENLTDDNRGSRRLIRGRSLDNPYLPDEYFDDLRATYPAHYLRAYLEGEFVNMAGRTVYDHYDHAEGLNLTDMTMAEVSPREQVHIGIDFNIDGMSAVIAVVRAGNIYVVDEILGSFNTMELSKAIKTKYPEFSKLLYPDPAGNQRRSSADNTDHQILRLEGFNVRNMASHPRIKDRVNSVNALFLNGLGERRLFINKRTCPGLHKALMSQVWDRDDRPKKGTAIGLPSTKNTLIDGPLDALGYFVYTNFPVRSGLTSNLRLVGV